MINIVNKAFCLITNILSYMKILFIVLYFLYFTKKTKCLLRSRLVFLHSFQTRKSVLRTFHPASQDICSLTSPKTKCLLRSRLVFLRSVTS